MLQPHPHPHPHPPPAEKGPGDRRDSADSLMSRLVRTLPDVFVSRGKNKQASGLLVCPSRTGVSLPLIRGQLPLFGSLLELCEGENQGGLSGQSLSRLTLQLFFGGASSSLRTPAEAKDREAYRDTFWKSLSLEHNYGHKETERILCLFSVLWSWEWLSIH